jgi:hypothetical protein
MLFAILGYVTIVESPYFLQSIVKGFDLLRQVLG